MTTLPTEEIAREVPALGGSVWNTFTPSTRMKAKTYVETVAVLLQGVLASNGDQRPDVLIDQLRATLSLNGPHSSLPMPASPSRPVRDLLNQAERINEQIVTWADDALSRLIDDPEPLSEPLLVRSHCEGHTLIQPAIHILLGPQGGPVPMMLYNEWIHQMVLLRDALLPFSNWSEVPLPVDGTGLRRLERPRETFLSELLIRQIRHTAIVSYARDVLVPDNDSHLDGYGFAYAEGTVLPTVVTSSSVLTSTDLLTWSPQTTVEDTDAVETYIPRETHYFEAPRVPAGTVARDRNAPTLAATRARIVTAPPVDGARYASLELTIPGRDVATVDLGQALRGHRYAYRITATEDVPRDATAWLSHATPLDPADVIAAAGLIWDETGDYRVDPGQDGLVALAVLGAIYPENVVLRVVSDDVRPSAVGKTGPARFVVTLPDGVH